MINHVEKIFRISEATKMRIYKIGDAAKYIGYKPNTLQRWDREGKLKAHRTPTNCRYYTQEQLDNWLNSTQKQDNGQMVAYTRVSSNHQKKNLKNQLAFIREYAVAKGIILDQEISDIGSGLNYKRPKWNKLLKQVEQGKINTIFITYKDRFIRFGFDWFEQFCKEHGTKIVVINNPDTSPETEIMQDLMAIVHVFSCRVYGLRKYQKDIDQLEKGEYHA